MPDDRSDIEFSAEQIKRWGEALGFQQIGVCGIELDEDESHLHTWLRRNFHGEMHYMTAHGSKRTHPEQLIPGTISVISARMDYMPPDSKHPATVLSQKELAYISRYATGRDYHKLLRRRLQQLAARIEQHYGDFGYRCFVDSAPVLEKALARNAGLGWIGKHSNLINPKAGSWFFLGEIYTDLPLQKDAPFEADHCGSCVACINICPTQAIIRSKQIDARRCISYLTIELRGSIPESFRSLIGNRVYGCDDCQLICPWNKFAKNTEEEDFHVRHGLDASTLVELFLWSEGDFLKKTEGSAIRRIGYINWLRNMAVGLGNASTTPVVVNALLTRQTHRSELVREHVQWALRQHNVSIQTSQ